MSCTTAQVLEMLLLMSVPSNIAMCSHESKRAVEYPHLQFLWLVSIVSWTYYRSHLGPLTQLGTNMYGQNQMQNLFYLSLYSKEVARGVYQFCIKEVWRGIVACLRHFFCCCSLCFCLWNIRKCQILFFAVVEGL